MRANHDHVRTARRAAAALTVVAATVLAAGAPASAYSDGSKTPLDVYKRFAFTFEVTVNTNEAEAPLTVSTKGIYVGPRSQDCKATVSLGQGLQVSQHAVIIGKATWVGVGHGPMKRNTGRDAFKFADQCASSRAFWNDFPFKPDPEVHGPKETRGGIAVEHIDLTQVLEDLGPFVDDLPADVTAERASIWRSKHGHVVVGVDIAIHATSSETCHDLLDLDATETAPSACSMAIQFDLSRIDDPKLQVHSVSAGHVTRT
jgi:hypothetical protein